MPLITIQANGTKFEGNGKMSRSLVEFTKLQGCGFTKDRITVLLEICSNCHKPFIDHKMNGCPEYQVIDKNNNL